MLSALVSGDISCLLLLRACHEAYNICTLKTVDGFGCLQIEEEQAQLRKMKQMHSSRGSASNPLQPWDQEFCKRHAKVGYL